MDPKFHCPEACRKVQSLFQFSMYDSLEILKAASIPLGEWKLALKCFQEILYEE